MPAGSRVRGDAGGGQQEIKPLRNHVNAVHRHSTKAEVEKKNYILQHMWDEEL